MIFSRPEGFCDNEQTTEDLKKESVNSIDSSSGSSDDSDNGDLFVNTNRPQCTYESSEASEIDDDK